MENLKKEEENMMMRLSMRAQNELDVRNNGGDRYKQLEARLLDPISFELAENITKYAIEIMSKKDDVLSYVNGFIDDIKAYPGKYGLSAGDNPAEYVKHEVICGLNRASKSEYMQDLWFSVMRNI